jgi:hypothetical protein
MTYKFFKTAIFSISALALVVISSCTKSLPARTDFTQTSDFVILTGAGTGNFKASNIQVNTSSPDTVTLTVIADLASANNNNGAVAVTIGLDNTQITTYNAANGTKFQPFPAGSFKIVNPIITIPAGQHYGTTTIQVYQNKLDPSISYILPVSITDASGKQLSSNQNTIFYNVIGNPIAGNYTHEWIRWNNATGTGTPAFDQTFSDVFAPVTSTTAAVQSGTGVVYLVSFTNTNGVLSNFTVAFPSDPSDPGSAAFNGITITAGPTIVLADPVNRTFTFTFTYLNSGGAARVIIDKLF